MVESPGHRYRHTEVFGLEFEHQGRHILVSAHDAEAADRLAAEAARLEWLAGLLPIPTVVAFERRPEQAWLVTTALDGTPASEPMQRVDGPALAETFAGALRAVHSIDAATCPFDARLAILRADVERRVAAGLVDPSDFGEAYRRYDPDRLLQIWLASEPAGEDVVVTHGDFRLDNVVIDAGEVTGYSGWGRCGVADRYVDLAVAARSLAAAVGPELVVAFFDSYGIENPSLAKVDFYALADEFR